MKRRLLIVAVFLLAGAVVNVAVAWTCALLRPDMRVKENNMRPLVRVDSQIWILMNEFRSLGWDYCSLNRPMRFTSKVTDVSWAGLTLPRSTTGQEFFGDASFHRAGWPLRSLIARHLSGGWLPKGSTDVRSLRTEVVTGFTPAITWQHAPFAVEYRILPLRPIWPGFAVNTIFYAVLLWLPFVVRRFVRVRRGLCPKCAYAMGESAVCTECGKALPHRAVA